MTEDVTPEERAAQQRAKWGDIQHGDNDPISTADLARRFGIGGMVDQKEPRTDTDLGDRPMCDGWHAKAGG